MVANDSSEDPGTTQHVSRGKTRRHDVLRVITERPNQLIYVDDIAERCELSRRQVQQAVSNLRAKFSWFREQVEVVVAGQAYRYNPPDVSDHANGAVSATATGGRSIDVGTSATPTDGTATAPAESADVRRRPSPVDVATSLERRRGASSADAPRTFSEIGTNDRGEVLVTDEHGNFYRLTALRKVKD